MSRLTINNQKEKSKKNPKPVAKLGAEVSMIAAILRKHKLFNG
ncbi:hypothetical protein [Psychromonas antarctica]|nr:hypothetical protein [Psychromonas antarctica]